MYLSDNLYDPYTLPKDMELPVRNGEDYYSRFDYLLLSEKDGSELKNKLAPLKNKSSLEN